MQSDLELQKKRHEIEGARRVEKHLRALEAERLKAEKHLVSYNQLLAPQRGEEFVYCVGEIGFVFLDLRSTRLEPGGAQAADNDLMSNLQWEFVEKNLESSKVQLWIVCSELPVVDEIPDVLLVANNTDSTSKTNPERQSWWGRNPEPQKRLLEMLFDWKMQASNRDFVLLSGASSLRFGGRSSVKDTKMRTKAEQYIVGAIAASPSRGEDQFSFTPRKTWTIHDRFEVEHVEITQEKAFTTLALSTSASLSSSTLDAGASTGKMDIQIACMSSRDHAHEMAQVLLGPVVGFVDDTSAVILLEVDRDFDLICVITNPLTDEMRRQYQHFRAKTPNSFFWTHLRSDHYYRISFENIQSATDFQASFSTVARFPSRFEIIALCNDDLLSASEVASERNDDGDGDIYTGSTTILWGSVADKAENVPFARVNLTTHLGGQFSAKTNVFVQEALALAEAFMVGNESRENGNLYAIAIEKLRQMYRLAWNLPGVHEALAHGAHIMLSNKSDELELASSSESELVVQELLTQVHQEYQNLLLPPSKRAQSRSNALFSKTKRAMKPLSHAFGAFGVFFLPIGEFGGVTVHSDAWDALKSFLRSPRLTVLTLVTQEAIVEDSPEDVAEKARFDSTCKTRFGFYQRELHQLLELMFEWKRTTDGSSSNGHEVTREVVFISGNRHRSFDSVIQEVASSFVDSSPHLEGTLQLATQSRARQVILQYVVGPMTKSRRARKGDLALASFPQGTLFNKYSYHNCFTKRSRNNRLQEQEQSDSTTAGDSPAASTKTGGANQSGNEGLISSQLAHFSISIEDEEPKSRANHAILLPDSTKPAFAASKWSLISVDPVEVDPLDDASFENALDERYRREGRIESHQVGRAVSDWRLQPVQPSWLDEVRDFLCVCALHSPMQR